MRSININITVTISNSISISIRAISTNTSMRAISMNINISITTRAISMNMLSVTRLVELSLRPAFDAQPRQPATNDHERLVPCRRYCCCRRRS